MSYQRSFRRLASLAALALLVPAACGGTSPTPSGGEGTSCAQAVDISAFVAGGEAYSGQATAEGDFQGLCASQKGSIEFLRFDAKPGNYEITLTGPHDSAVVNAVLDVRTDCASPASELACNPHAASPTTVVGVSKPGGVILVLSGDWYGEGYQIRIAPAPPCYADYGCAKRYPQTRCATKLGVCFAPLDCAPGTADCNADPNDGCETDLTKDTANCGACGVSCLVPNVKSPTCAASSCVLVCEPGYADCDQAPGCETYLPGDGANCGACGNDCMHGGCEASTCTAPPDTLGTTGVMLWNGPIALDAAKVYVGGELPQSTFGVVSVPKSGGAATLFAKEGCLTSSILVDAATVYWAVGGCAGLDAAIKSKPAAGSGSTKVLASDPNRIRQPGGLVADATSLYLFDVANATLLSLPRAGGTPKTVAGVQNAGGTVQILALAADATTLYFTSRDFETRTMTISSVPKSGGTPKMLVTLPPGSTGQLAISGTYLYVATATNISRISTSGGALTPFASANLGPATPNSTQGITSLAIAGGNLYWSEGTTPDSTGDAFGGIWRIPLAGGAAVGLASDEPPGPIAADASGVYMSATSSGAVALRAGP